MKGLPGSTLERRVDLVYEEGGGRHTVAQLLVASLSRLDQEVRQMLRHIFVVEALRAAALILTIGMREVVTRRLQPIIRFADRVSVDNLDEPLKALPSPFRQRDDITVLSQAIKRMREPLRRELDLRRDLEKSSREMAIERQAAGCQPGQKRFSGEHEPRNPHADESDHRHGPPSSTPNRRFEPSSTAKLKEINKLAATRRF